MQSLPEPLQQILHGLTRSFSAAKIRDFREDLSQRYHQGQGIETQGHRISYLTARLPATYGVIVDILKRLISRVAFEEIKTALDLGAGPGTGAWALHAYFSHLNSITCIEKDTYFMVLGQKITTPLPEEVSWIHQDLTHLSFSTPHDIVLMSYVLGELKPQDQWPLVQKAFSLTQKFLILVEPGTPEGYQRLMELRRHLIQEGAYILAPCPHDRECPLLKKGGDWCHFSVRLPRSSLHRYVKKANLMWEDEPYAYLVVSPYPPLSTMPSSSRILKPPRRRPGHILLDMCTSGGLEPLTISKSDKAFYAKAKKAKWGDEWPYF